MSVIRLTTVLLAGALLVSSAGETQVSGDEYSFEDDIAKHPLKPPDTSSPQATLQSFLDSMNLSYRILMAAHRENTEARGWLTPKSVRRKARRAEEIFKRGVYCLNLTDVPTSFKQDIGNERALHLKEILDRIELPPFHQRSDAESIEKEEDQESVSQLDRWRVPNTNIVIARIEDGPRNGEYLFTPETVARLGEFYNKVKDLPYKSDVFVTRGFLDFYLKTPGRLLPPKWARWLPAWSKKLYLSLTIWQWCALAILLLSAFLFLMAVYRGLLSRAATHSPAKRYWRRGLFCLIAVATLFFIHYVGDTHVNITGSVLVALRFILSPVFWLLLAAASSFLGRGLAETIIASPKIDPEGIQASYIRALFCVLGFLSAAAIMVFGLSRLGVSLIPLLTGVGIGGLAIALAARPTLESIIGSFTIFADNPYKVGQRVKVMGHNGTVESIGLRSTRIRLLSGHVTTIPNEKMASMDIENIGRRPYIRRIFNITITYDMSPGKINRAVEILREILALPEAPHPKTTDSGGESVDATTKGETERQAHPNEAINKPDFPPRVYFNEFNADSLNIYVSYWYHPPDYWDYMDHAHWINIQIIERFNAEGIDFAFPTQTLHLAGDKKRPLTVGQRWESKETSNSSSAVPAKGEAFGDQPLESTHMPASESVRPDAGEALRSRPKADRELTVAPIEDELLHGDDEGETDEG